MNDIGVQCFTYREFSLESMCDALADSPVGCVELMGTHVDPSGEDHEVDRVLDILDEAGLVARGYYGIPDDGRTVEEALSFVADFGVEYVSVDFSPDAEEYIDTVLAAAEEFDLNLAVHNHGPEAIYATVEDVETVLRDRPERLGACLDTGHFLRSDNQPAEAFHALSGRIHAVHVKDFVDTETEVTPGEGNLDLDELVELHAEHAADAPLVIEYEAEPSNPTPAVRGTAEALADRL